MLSNFIEHSWIFLKGNPSYCTENQRAFMGLIFRLFWGYFNTIIDDYNILYAIRL